MHFREEKQKEYIGTQLGEIYTDSTFDNYRDTYGVIPSIKKAVDDKNSVYLYGDSRTGKTHLAAAIMRYISEKYYEKPYKIRKGWDYEKCIDIFEEGMNKYYHDVYAQKCVLLDNIISDYKNESRMDDINYIKSREILILDDIGVGKLTPERQSMYYYIIDHRISNGMQTIFTSNYRTHDLWNGSTDEDPKRLITRIREMCVGIEIKK
jgi:DNA replication protein DnaC